MRQGFVFVGLILGLSAGLLAIGCGEGGGPDDDGGDGSGDPGSGAGSGVGSGGGDGSLNPIGSGSGGSGSGNVCATESSSADVQPVYLGFAFDVSGSMGKLDEPNWWHDPAKKWEPVVAATRAFFEDDASEGLQASMALFPASDDHCDAESYEDPDVGMRALPSTAFGAVLDDYEDGAWRGGTPTLAAFEGTVAYLDGLRAASPGGKYVVVLVTDGLPQSCSGVDVSDVVAAVQEVNDDGILTYVIGVQNPTEPPASLPAGWDEWGCGSGDMEPCAPAENLTALGQIATAGGTELVLIDTDGTAEDTADAFTAAINAIRDEAVSCTVEIPEHPEGGAFEPDKIDVTFGPEGGREPLGYDPTCPGGLGWRYDDEENPTSIQLCEATCASIQAATTGDLVVEFLCQPRTILR